jgi:gentisate 1,2-dioxygenase
MNSKVFELSKVLSELDGQGGYFIDFINTKSIQAGIIRLHPGEDDNQEPHSVDEVYYVIEGNGWQTRWKRSSNKTRNINFCSCQS